MTFLASQSDRLIMGKFFPLEILGIYTIAFTFAEIPKKIITQISSKILFPVFSKKILLPREELRKKILSKRKFLLIFAAFLVAILYSFGDIIIDVLYDQRYQEASWMLPILTLGLWPLILNVTIGSILLSLGKPQYDAFSTFIKFIYMIILLPLVLTKLDLWWGILVIGFNDVGKYIAYSYGLWKEGFSCLRQDAIMTLLLITFIACLILVRN
jgi:O-antigen/teichoic acid export membrane protein